MIWGPFSWVQSPCSKNCLNLPKRDISKKTTKSCEDQGGLKGELRKLRDSSSHICGRDGVLGLHSVSWFRGLSTFEGHKRTLMLMGQEILRRFSSFFLMVEIYQNLKKTWNGWNTGYSMSTGVWISSALKQTMTELSHEVKKWAKRLLRRLLTHNYEEVSREPTNLPNTRTSGGL